MDVLDTRWRSGGFEGSGVLEAHTRVTISKRIEYETLHLRCTGPRNRGR
jgi:hypothetical protein